MSPLPLRAVRSIALSSLLLLAACGLTRYEATRERALQEGAAGLTALSCTSHNGGIDVVGVEGSNTITVRARLGAGGETQAEADACVAQLDVAMERRGTELVIAGVVPEAVASGTWFEFTIEMPPHLALRLLTHNGGIDVRAASGQLAITSHNGSISAATSAAAVALETHNGGIELELTGDGPVQGDITSHNGTVELSLGSRAAVVDASTQNGWIETAESLQVQQRDDDTVQVVAGRNGGKLTVVTHNGGVSIR